MARLLIRWGLLAVVAAVVVVAVLTVNPLASLSWFDDNTDVDAGGEDAADVAAPRDRSEIAVSDLSVTIEVDGELRFADGRDVSAGRAGTLTSTVVVGRQVDAATELFAIDGEPTVALLGDVPAWRSLTVDDVGVDVEQLETNLAALGYDPDGIMTVDETYTAVTATAVQRWQADLGIEETGAVDVASIVFVPADAAVSALSATTGDQVSIGSPLLTVATTARELSFPVETAQLDTIAVGASVSSQLPDRTTVTATVIELGPSGDGGWEGVAELATVGDDVTLPEGDAVPVSVSWDEQVAAGVTTVRASEIVRLDSGRYALEVVGDDNSTEFVPVEVGARSGSTIEVITDLAVGTEIISP